jgi:L,D-peptidoglycan transpeptidase YkuD (ErfK/YbiS/YcfS/YnhG family)
VKENNLAGTMIRHAVILFALLSLTACAAKIKTSDLLSVTQNIAPDTRQILLVADEGFLSFAPGKVYALEKSYFAWRQAMNPFNAVIGRKGFAPPGEKREGDGRTPSGVYPLETAFGYAEIINTKMPYRQALADDLWVDDPNAADYNRWVKKHKTRAASYEKMRRDDHLYEYGIVIEYNTKPVIKGQGSAIFLHVWKEPGATTAGCVAVSEPDILKILSWLDPLAGPVIVLNPKPKSLKQENP